MNGKRRRATGRQAGLILGLAILFVLGLLLAGGALGETGTTTTDSTGTTATSTTATDSTSPTTDTTATAADVTGSATTSTDAVTTTDTSTDASTTTADAPAPPLAPASLATDAATYVPGATVDVSGAHWLPGEAIHIHAADTGGHGWSYDTDALAAADGSVTASFPLPTTFAGGFAVAATGAVEGTVSTSFTDAFAAVTGPAAIVSDQTDYAPGSTVTLTGSGWQPLEPVHLYVNDSVGNQWEYNADVTADSTGHFTNQFQLPNYFVATYAVTATGTAGETATASFTDGNVKVVTAPTGVTASVTRTIYSTSTNCSTGAGTASNISATNSSVTIGGISTSESIRLDAPATADQAGSNFQNWTSSDSFTTISGTGGRSICVPGPSGTATYTANYTAPSSNTPPVVAANNSSVTANEGSSATNTGTWSDQNGSDTVNLSATVGTMTEAGTNASGTWSWSLATTDGPAGPTTVTITADDGHTTTTTTFTYSVTNVAPTVTAASNQTATAGTSASFSLGSFSDPGSDSPWPVDVNWGDGSTHATFNVTNAGAASNLTIPAQSHTYTSISGSPYTISVEVTDKDGGTDTKTFTVTVQPEVRSTTTGLTSNNNPSTYGDSLTFTATVTATGGNPNGDGSVTFEDGTNTICDAVALSGDSATCQTSALTAADSPHSITAVYSGTSSGSPQFQGSTSDPLTQTVNKAGQTIAFDGLADKTYGDAAFTVSATGGASGNPVTFSASGNCTSSGTNGSTITITGAGSCTVTADQAGNDNYSAAASVPQSFNIAKKAAGLTFDLSSLPAKTFGDADFSVASYASADSPATITFATGSGSVGCSVTSAGTVSITGAATGTDTCIIEASTAATANYLAGGPVPQSFNIAKATPSFSFSLSGLPAKTYGDTSFSVASYASKPTDDTGAVTFSTASGSVGCSVTSAGMVSITGAAVGTDYCVIQASLAADSNYLAAGPTSDQFQIAKATLTVTADNKSITLGQATPAFTVQYSGFVGTDDKTSLGGTLGFVFAGVSPTTYGPSATAPTQAGTYSVTPSGYSSGNYTFDYHAGSFDILYAASGTCLGNPGHQILQPINATAPISVFKQGSTVPAKFRVCDANGNSIGTPGVVTSFIQGSVAAGVVQSVNEIVDSTTPDTGFRWDPTAQQWIFNMSTKGLKAGSMYTWLITLNDGSMIQFQFALK